jgi:hypothetical protein
MPKVGKEASSVLVDLGGVIHSTAEKEEVDVLIRGTLHQEVYVRNSCLQALQVCAPFFMGSSGNS